MTNLDFHRLSEMCAWINTLPVYMFQGELTAALLIYAYDKDDLTQVDHAVRMVLNFQAFLAEPLHYQAFIKTVELVMIKEPPPELVSFLAREVTH